MRRSASFLRGGLALGFVATAGCHLGLGIDVDERSLERPSPVIPGGEGGSPSEGGGILRDAAMPVVGDGGPPACDPSTPFGAPEELTELTNPSLDFGSARLSADERTLFFAQSPVEGNYHAALRTAIRGGASGPFGAPTSLPFLDHPDSPEANATLTADGLTLYLDAFRDENDAGIYRSTAVATRARATDPFVGRKLIPTLRSGLDGRTEVSDAYVVPDGRAIYVASFFPDLFWHIERATINGPTVSLLAPVGIANAKYPVVSPDERTLYLASSRNRPAPADQFDLDVFVATRPTKDDPWSEPRVLAEVNSPRQDVPTWISADGCRLYLSSNRNRPGAYYAPRSIYRASRTPR
jgi:hypothetical protein